MNILHITADCSRGGAAKSLCLLHDALRVAGHDSRVLAGRPVPTERNEMAMLEPMPGWARVPYHGLNLLGLNYAGIPVTGRIAAHPYFHWADVVHYHNLHGGYFNYLALPRLTRLKPSVWTLRDMWGLTGHCAHSFECERWRTGCGRCPHPKIDPPIRRDATRVEWRLKRWVYRRSGMLVTAPSRWLCELARASILGCRPVRQVPNAVDTAMFRPRDKRALRRALSWPESALILLFVAESLDNPFKDFALLPAALSRLAAQWRERVVLVALGSRPAGLEAACGGFRMLAPGYLADAAAVADCHAAADLLVYPTRADNQPRVVLEAMACGCPVVASAIGGLPELVEPGQTGYLARPGDAADLGRQVDRLLTDADGRQRMGRAGRRLVEARHAIDGHMAAMLAAYVEAARMYAGRQTGAAHG